MALTAQLLSLDRSLIQVGQVLADTEEPENYPNIPQLRRKRQSQDRLAKAEVLTLTKAHLAGSTVHELAALFEIDRTTVLEHLKREGIPRRPNVRKLTDAEVAAAAVLYRDGLSTVQLGTHFDVNAETIRRELRRAGVQLRAARGRSGSDPTAR